MISPPDKIQFSGIVINFNEAKYLKKCIESLSFCDQILVFDLGSTDDSVSVAQKNGAEVIRHEWVPIADQIRQECMQEVIHKWVIFIDPDEVFPVNISNLLVNIIQDNDRLAKINIPWQFYFKGKPLNYTIWGIEKTKGVVVHKDRVKMNPYVHMNDDIIGNYTTIELERNSDNFIRHYWIDSYAELIRRHWKYIKLEGKARYCNGARFDSLYLVKNTLFALKVNLIDYGGLKGGLNGIILSFFYSAYIFASILSLRFYQSKSETNQRAYR